MVPVSTYGVRFLGFIASYGESMCSDGYGSKRWEGPGLLFLKNLLSRELMCSCKKSLHDPVASL